MKFWSILLCIWLFACQSNDNQTREHIKSTTRYAKHFQLFEYQNHQIIHVLNPKTNKLEKKIWISDHLPQSTNESYIYIQPHQVKLCPMASSHIGMLNRIEVLDRVSALPSQNYLDNVILKKAIQHGKILEVGFENQLQLEKLLRSNTNLISYSGFGTEFPQESKLKKLGVLTIQNYDWEELNPLGRAEWILFFGALTGKLNEAKNEFQHIERNYLHQVKRAKRYRYKKEVISGNLVGDVWYLPAGQSYAAQLFKDAQIRYRYEKKKGTGSIALSLEEILKNHRHTNIWLNPGVASKKALALINPKLKHLKAFQNNQIYCYSHRMNFYWENASLMPDRILSDYIEICHGRGNKVLYFYKKIKP